MRRSRLLLGALVMFAVFHIPTASAVELGHGECRALRDAADSMIVTGRYYVLATMQLPASAGNRGASAYVAAFLLASGPRLQDWKIMVADADVDHMTRLCVRYAGKGVRVRRADNYWPAPQSGTGRDGPSGASPSFPGCPDARRRQHARCVSLLSYLRQPDRAASATLLLKRRGPVKRWYSLAFDTHRAAFEMRRHGQTGDRMTQTGIDFRWKPNLAIALERDPMLPVGHVDLTPGNQPPRPPPAHAHARRMISHDGNWAIDLYWTGPEIDAVRDARRAQTAHPPRAYEVQMLDDANGRVLDTVYSYRPYLKYTGRRQRRASGDVFGDRISVRIRSLGRHRRPGPWKIYNDIPIKRDYPHVIVTGGQSNVEAWFNRLSGKLRDNRAYNVFRRQVATTLRVPPYDVAVFNVSQGGSGVDRSARSTPTHYWYNLEKKKAGPLLRQALRRLGLWQHVDLMVWLQGERETFATATHEHHRGETRTSPARWQRATEAIFRQFRAAPQTPSDLPIVFAGLGRLWYASKQVNEKQRDRYLAQQIRLIKSQPHTWFGVDVGGFVLHEYQPLFISKVHYGPGMYHIIAHRMGRFVGQLLLGLHPRQLFPRAGQAPLVSIDDH